MSILSPKKIQNIFDLPTYKLREHSAAVAAKEAARRAQEVVYAEGHMNYVLNHPHRVLEPASLLVCFAETICLHCRIRHTATVPHALILVSRLKPEYAIGLDVDAIPLAYFRRRMSVMDLTAAWAQLPKSPLIEVQQTPLCRDCLVPAA